MDLAGNSQGFDDAYANNHIADPQADDLRGALEGGASVLVLANINGRRDGMLEGAGTSTDDIPHWVNVLSVSEDINGQTYARVYNPYQKREEVYTWDEFKAAWNSPSADAPGYTYVAAQPPDNRQAR